MTREADPSVRPGRPSCRPAGEKSAWGDFDCRGSYPHLRIAAPPRAPRAVGPAGESRHREGRPGQTAFAAILRVRDPKGVGAAAVSPARPRPSPWSVTRPAWGRPPSPAQRDHPTGGPRGDRTPSVGERHRAGADEHLVVADPPGSVRSHPGHGRRTCPGRGDVASRPRRGRGVRGRAESPRPGARHCSPGRRAPCRGGIARPTAARHPHRPASHRPASHRPARGPGRSCRPGPASAVDAVGATRPWTPWTRRAAAPVRVRWTSASRPPPVPRPFPPPCRRRPGPGRRSRVRSGCPRRSAWRHRRACRCSRGRTAGSARPRSRRPWTA